MTNLVAVPKILPNRRPWVEIAAPKTAAAANTTGESTSGGDKASADPKVSSSGQAVVPPGGTKGPDDTSSQDIEMGNTSDTPGAPTEQQKEGPPTEKLKDESQGEKKKEPSTRVVKKYGQSRPGRFYFPGLIIAATLHKQDLDPPKQGRGNDN